MSEQASAPARCSRCGATMPPNAPEGLCPHCVLAMNLSTETELKPEPVGPGGTAVSKPSPPPPLPPAEVAKSFPQLEILEALGRGGMGAVYKARQPRLDRIVALKILSPEKQGDSQFAERFEREARTLARLNHPNIVTIYDFGEVQGHFYLLMEYVDGLSLRHLLQSRKLPADEALAIVPKICEALQYAHQRGIVHRDIKPENILLDKAGTVKIADFGIAKLLGQQASSGLTQEQQVIGTPHYMAPEQVEKPGTVDHRADIYSLGVVFYEMLTGELPLGRFAAPSRKVQVDVRLDEVVLRALEKEPGLRYQQASVLKTDVETISHTPPRIPAPTAPQPAQAAARANSSAARTQTAAMGSPPQTRSGSARLRWWLLSAVLLCLLPLALVPALFVQRAKRGAAAPDTAPASNRASIAPPQPALPWDNLPASLVDIQTYLAEVPAGFQPGGHEMEHNWLRRQHGVRIRNLPHLVAPNGSWSEIRIADLSFTTSSGVPAHGVTLRSRAALDKQKVTYEVSIGDGAPPAQPEATATEPSPASGTSISRGTAPEGAWLPFNIGILGQDRRLIGVVVFHLSTETHPSVGDPPAAFISNPEFQQVVTPADADSNGMLFFSFETGRLLKPPVAVPFDPDQPDTWAFSPELRRWLQAQDVDVLFVLGKQQWHAVTLDLEQQPLRGSPTLEDFTLPEVNALLPPPGESSLKPVASGQITASFLHIGYDDRARTPAAAFRTRKGNSGVFKWTRVTDSPPGVKIRYRLWQN